jgi:hypothetical protein
MVELRLGAQYVNHYQNQKNTMKETQEILLKMGFENIGSNAWSSDWFGLFLLTETATPEELAKFIYHRGIRNLRGDKAPSFKCFNL